MGYFQEGFFEYIDIIIHRKAKVKEEHYGNSDEGGWRINAIR